MFNQSEKKLKTWATIQGMFFSVVAIILGAVIYSAAAATDNNAVGLLLGGNRCSCCLVFVDAFCMDVVFICGFSGIYKSEQ